MQKAKLPYLRYYGRQPSQPTQKHQKQADLGEKRRLRPEAVFTYSERKKTAVEKSF
jgi:hypothetical protein